MRGAGGGGLASRSRLRVCGGNSAAVSLWQNKVLTVAPARLTPDPQGRRLRDRLRARSCDGKGGLAGARELGGRGLEGEGTRM